jgi:predicted transcriptional regulator
MTDIDDELIKHGLTKGMNEKQILKELKDLVDKGLLEKNQDGYRLTKFGTRYVEDVILKRKN